MTSRSHPLPVAVRATTAAALLDCSRSHIYELIERGELRRVSISDSRSVRIPIEDIYAVLGLDMPTPSSGAR